LDLDDDRFGFARIEGEHTAVEDLAAVNPNVKGGDRMYTQNCGNCVVAYEVRRRGYDVEAAAGNLVWIDEIHELFEGFQPLTLKGQTLNEINEEFEAVAKTWGDGARGIISGAWLNKGSGGHAFSLEVAGGKVMFVDGQSGVADVSGYLKRMDLTSVVYGRVDNLKLGDGVVSLLVKGRGFK